MERACLCPRSEICYIYKIYVDNTKDDTLAIVRVSTIEGRDFYSCRALSAVLKFAAEGRLPPETAERLPASLECLMIDQANKQIERHRLDL